MNGRLKHIGRVAIIENDIELFINLNYNTS